MKSYVDKYVEPYAHKCPYCDNERNFVHGRYKDTCKDKACVQKHREATNLVRFGDKCSLKGSNEQKVVDAIVEKYGVDNVFKLDSMQKLARKRTKEKYGHEYASQVPEIRKKVEDTCMVKFGHKTNLLNPDQIEQIKQTCVAKYGHEYVCASEYTKQRTIEHNMAHYGVPWFMQSDVFKQKSRHALLGKHCVDNSMKSPIVYNKSKQSLMNHYGVTYPMQSPIIRERSRQTMVNRYGVEFAAQLPGKITPHIYTKTDLGYFSRSEKTFADQLDALGISYKYNWYHNKKHWDFAIIKNGAVDTVVEIDGEYHHGYTADWKNLRLDAGRFHMLGDGIKLICGDSKRLPDIVAMLLQVLNMTYQEWITFMANAMPVSFPYPTYTNSRLTHDYALLCTEFTSSKYHKTAQYGMSIIYMYNKSMYHRQYANNVRIDVAWAKQDMRQQCIAERSLYYSPISSANPIMGLAVSNIMPMPRLVATGTYLYIIKKYVSHCTIIQEVQPFNGALMLAVCAANKSYQCIACDPDVLVENRAIADVLNLGTINNVDTTRPCTRSCVVCDLTCNSLKLNDIMRQYPASLYVCITYDKDLLSAYDGDYDVIRSNYGPMTDIKYIKVINYHS